MSLTVHIYIYIYTHTHRHTHTHTLLCIYLYLYLSIYISSFSIYVTKFCNSFVYVLDTELSLSNERAPERDRQIDRTSEFFSVLPHRPPQISFRDLAKKYGAVLLGRRELRWRTISEYTRVHATKSIIPPGHQSFRAENLRQTSNRDSGK